MAIAAALPAVSSPPPLAAQQPTVRYEEGFFDIQLPRVGRSVGVVTLVDSAGSVLIPLRAVLELTGIAATWTPDSLTVQWPAGPWRTVLHPRSREVVNEQGRRLFAATDWVAGTGDLFLSDSALASILGVSVTVDFAELTVTIAPDPGLPALRRLTLERRRRPTPGEAAAEPATTIEYPPRTGGFALSWGVSAYESRTAGRASFRAAAGAAAWGGALEAGGALGFADDQASSLEDEFVRWSRAFPGNTVVTQVHAGTIFAQAPAGRRINGASVSNEPWTAPRHFDEAVIEPAVPAGWEYEVYHGGHLVGVGSAEDPAGVRTPINYGNNPLRIRMIGPSGQEVVEDLVLLVRPGMTAAGTWRYSAGAGVCADDGCDDYAWAELRRGFSRRLTAGLGAERITPFRAEARVRPWLATTATPIDNLALELQLQPNAMVRSALQLNTARRGSWAASYAWFRPAGNATSVGGWNASLTSSHSFASRGNRFLNTRIQLRGAETDRIDIWQLSIASTLRGLHTSLGWESGLQTRDILTLRTFASWPSPDPLRPLRDVSLAASIGVSEAGAEIAELTASARPRPTTTLNAGLRLRRGHPPALTLGFAARLDAAYTQARASRTHRTAGLFLAADGGVAWDPRIGHTTTPFESIGRAGIGGTAFEDLDGDGRPSPGEPPLANAAVHIGTQTVHTDAHGNYRVWLVQPYDAIPVALDSLHLPTQLTPIRHETRVRPSPNSYARVDLGAARTREVIGSVTSSTPLPRLGGIGIEILDANGNLAATTRTFHDGEFYIPRLRPGTYTLRIAAASLAALDAFANPDTVSFTVTSGTEPLALPVLLVGRD